MCFTKDEDTTWFPAVSAPKFQFARPSLLGTVSATNVQTITTETPLFSRLAETDDQDTSMNGFCQNQTIIDRHKLREPLSAIYFENNSSYVWFDRKKSELTRDKLDSKLDPEIDCETLEKAGVVLSLDSVHNDCGPPKCLGQQLLVMAHLKSFLFGIQSCSNPLCLHRRKRFESSAPACEWRPFREAILTILGCWMPRLVSVFATSMFLDPGETVSVCLDLQGLVQLMQWARRLAYGTRIGARFAHMSIDMGKRYAFEYILDQVLAPGYRNNSVAIEISRKCANHGICPNRLWNLSIQSSLTSGIFDIPHIAEMALRVEFPRSIENHSSCSAQVCLHSDVNNTSVEQAHKDDHCSGSSCQDVSFPTSILDEVFAKDITNGAPTWHPTAWYIPSGSSSQPMANFVADFVPSMWKKGQSGFVAISHVWSDGTGAGIKGPGQINACLLRYFASVVEHERCDGLWWDSICIPRERKARSIAIDTMLDNYKEAKCTVVHDQGLVNFEWKEDGSPAIALVLSAWFTRGWTAGELFASRHHPVKVIYKNPDPKGKPLLKDLDKDILAWDSLTDRGRRLNSLTSKLCEIPRLGHYVVTDIIKHFRTDIFHDGEEASQLYHFGLTTKFVGSVRLNSILHLMRGRTTSWARDRMLIAGLIGLPPDVSISTTTGPGITMKLMEYFESISFGDLLHVAVPISEFGPWSWCPPSIFDFGNFPQTITQRAFSTTPPMQVKLGRTVGSLIIRDRYLLAYSVLDDDLVIPASTHPSTKARVFEAMSKRSHCILLTHDVIADDGRLFILCMLRRIKDVVEGDGTNGYRILDVHCRWVACVYLNRRCGHPHNLNEQNSHRGNSDQQIARLQVGGSFDPPRFIFGSHDDPAEQSVEFQYLRCYQDRLTGELGEYIYDENVAIIWLSKLVVVPLFDPPDDNAEIPAIPRGHAWIPQPVHLYILRERRETGTPFVHTVPSTMIVDLNSPENKIALSTVPFFLDELKYKVNTCIAKHGFLCAGTVELSWDIVARPIPKAVDETNMSRKQTFHFTFHIVPQITSRGYRTGISIGQEGFRDHFMPLSRKVFTYGELVRKNPKISSRVGLLLAQNPWSRYNWEAWDSSVREDMRLQPGQVIHGFSLYENQTLRQFSKEEIEQNQFLGISDEVSR